ncbi:hypothetical protein [Chondrinema litorale]|uniref:hypothetical protein n=1 Tax=Chondrinema litorale TaxID=2994555 RepID=UPI002542AB7F|nr:hypothetical protein [Chondrinema litorale]UZR99613.1 hypothetical protein OQ292_37120 [Chondrinema litorale]
MKWVLVWLVAMTLIAFKVNAQEGYNYLDIAGGYLVKDTYGIELSLEFGKRYHNQLELLFDYAHNTHSERNNYMLGLAYKPLITRKRNTVLNLRVSAALGTNEYDFIAGISTGLELNFAFSNGWIFFLRPKGDLVLWDKDHWRIGMLAGVKFPIN